ncbi:hypothetical protein MKX64_23300 [Paenibacillus sp. FSL M8-0334]|uniref:hypothetical protein n=1 Tax=Paenibacillus sp. FSL M8-0334 TaxID=2921623 RepID=UPI0030FC8E90
MAAVFIGALVLSYAMNMNVPGAYSFSTLFNNIQETMSEFFHEWTDRDDTNAKTLPPLPTEGEKGNNAGFQNDRINVGRSTAECFFFDKTSRFVTNWL